MYYGDDEATATSEGGLPTDGAARHTMYKIKFDDMVMSICLRCRSSERHQIWITPNGGSGASRWPTDFAIEREERGERGDQ